MRIVLDLQACQNAGSRFRGIGRYSKSLALAMLREGRGHDFWIALNGALADSVEDIRASFDNLLPQEQIVLWNNPFPASASQAETGWSRRVAEVLREDFLGALKPDFVHLASLFEGWSDVATTSIGRGSTPRIRTAVTLYDFIPLTMGKLYLPDTRIRRWYERKVEDLRQADLLLAISAFTRDEAVQLLGLPAGRIVNISGSSDPIFRRLGRDAQRDAALAARYGVSRPFVMYVGGFDPRKNLSGLLRAFAALPGPVRERRQLVIVGSPPPGVQSELSALAIGCGLSGDDVRFVGFVPDADLVGLYNACALYVFPSRGEGFGLPVLEAMACGAPVIGADAASLPEVIGYPEAMFAADSDDAMAAKLLQGLEDERFRAQLIEHGAEHVQRFSWEQSACAALDAMEGIAAQGQSASPVRPTVVDEDLRWQQVARQSTHLSRLSVAGRPSDANSARRLAAAQSENFPWQGRGKQLIVDISSLVGRDVHAGSECVVRNILHELLQSEPDGFDVTPVYCDEAGVFRHARLFLQQFLREEESTAQDHVLDAGPGDVFLGLGSHGHVFSPNHDTFDRMRRRGVSLCFVVYGLTLPDAWLRGVATLADGVCCISRATAVDLVQWCDQTRPERLRPLRIGHFQPATDLDGRLPTSSPAIADPESLRESLPTWRDSTHALLKLVLNQEWDRSWLASGRYWFPANDARLHHQVGRVEGGKLLTDGRSGYLVYGPYAVVPCGTYLLRVLGSWIGTGGPSARLDVVTCLGKVQLARIEIRPQFDGRQDTLVEARLELATHAQDLELRLWVRAESTFYIRGFELLGL